MVDRWNDTINGFSFSYEQEKNKLILPIVTIIKMGLKKNDFPTN